MTDTSSNVLPFKKRSRRALSAPAALKYMRESSNDGILEVPSYTALAGLLGWDRAKTWKAVDRWQKAGKVIIESGPESGTLVLRIPPDKSAMKRGRGTGVASPKRSSPKRNRGSQNAAIGYAAGVPKTMSETSPKAVPEASTQSAELVATTPATSKTYGTRICADSPPLSALQYLQIDTADTSGNSPVSAPENAPKGTPTEAAQGAPMSAPAETLPQAPDAPPTAPPQRVDNPVPAPHAERLDWYPAPKSGGGGGGGNFSAAKHTALDVLAILSAISLAGITAWLSINGMVVLFPGLPIIALLLGVAIEGSKITTSAWLGRHWGDAAWMSRVALIGFTAMCAMLNAASVYSQLVQAHVGARGSLEASTATRSADTAGRIDVAQDKVADLDRRLRQIDDTISEARRRGRTREALRSMDQQRQARAAIAGDPNTAGMWINHLRRVYGDDANHIIYWLAHRVQRPHEKVNHALVLGGKQGIGKATMLEPVKHAIGSWNFTEVGPQNLLGNFNGFLKSVILRVSEARDLGDVDRFKFYDHSKTLIAAPPDVLRVNEKNLREHYIPNVTGVIITTNHKTDGIFLPADDRRHFVAWSDLTKEDFPESYWNALWCWYHSGGLGHVAAYLAAIDLAPFDPKAPPPKTEAFWAIVDAGHAPEDAELADVLDSLGTKTPEGETVWPDAVTIPDIAGAASAAGGGFLTWITDRKNRRAIPHRMEQCGYVPVRNDQNSGRWIIGGTRQVVYARSDLSLRDRILAAEKLTR